MNIKLNKDVLNKAAHEAIKRKIRADLTPEEFSQVAFTVSGDAITPSAPEPIATKIKEILSR